MSEVHAPPQSPEAEENVLGACLISPAAIDAVTEILEPGDFYRPSNGALFSAIVRLHQAGEPVDVLTLSDATGESARVHELARIVPASANVVVYARIVKRHAVRRGVLNLALEAARLANEDVEDLVDRVEQLAFDLDRHGVEEQETLADTLAGIVRNISYMREHPREVVGVPTGYKDLDAITQGFQPGNLIICAARPGMGKSAFAICVAGQLATARGLPVGFWSLEMSKAEILQRMLSMGSGIDVPKIRAPWYLTDAQEAQLIQAAGRIATIPLEIREPATLRPLELRAQVRRWKAQNPEAALVIVDYLQLMDGGKHSENRTHEVSHISRMLKVLAREMEVPVLALSQLSRAVEARTDKRPMLSDLRESGAIEQDADVVLMLFRPDYYDANDQPGVVEVHVAKNRNGETGTARLAFIRGQTRFSSLARPHLAGDMAAQATLIPGLVAATAAFSGLESKEVTTDSPR